MSKKDERGDLTTWGAQNVATGSNVTTGPGAPRTPEQRARAIVAWLTQGKARGESIDAETWTRAITAEIEGAVEAEKARSTEAIAIAVRFGGIDGDHHKAWVIDQMVRALTGCPEVRESAVDARGQPYEYTTQGESAEYRDLVAKARAGEDGPETYSWDVGIAP